MDFSLLGTAFEVAMRIAQLTLEYLKVLVWPLVVLTLALIYKRPVIDVLGRLRKATGWGATLELEHEARELADESAQIAELNQAAIDRVDHDSDTEARPGTTPTAPESSAAAEAKTEVDLTEPIRTTSQQIRRSDAMLPPNTTIDTERLARVLRAVAQSSPTIDTEKLAEAIQTAARTVNFNRLSSTPTPRTSKYGYTPIASRRYRMLNAWRDLERAGLEVGQCLGLTKNHSRHIPALVSELADRGLVSGATTDVAYGLYNLRNRIRHDDIEDAELTSAVVTDFIEATRNLTTILTSLSGKLREDLDNRPKDGPDT